MASHVVVIDSTFRRANIKVTPQTHLSDVLEQACTKLSLRSEQYGLKHKHKQIDLSLTYRLSGLHSGAQLELVQISKSPSVVNIALQLPNNNRLTGKFPSSTTLWQLLRQFESGAVGDTGPNAINITQRGIAQTVGGAGAGRLYYEMPVLYIMNREIASFVELQKTLAQIGVTSGSSLLRLHYRNEGQPLEEAMAMISEFFKEEPAATQPPAEETPAAVHADPDSTGPPQSNPASAQSELLSPESKQPESSQPSSPQPEPPQSNTNNSKHSRHSLSAVYSAPTSDTPAAAAQPFNEADYVPTVDHAKIHQSRLNNSSRNQRLPSDAELAKQWETKQSQIAQVQKIRVRIRLPDLTQIEDEFTPQDTTADLFGFVQLALRHPGESFILRHTDAKGKHVPLTNDAKTFLIKGLGWTGATQIYMLWGDDVLPKIKQEPTLNDDTLAKAKQLKVETPATDEPMKEENSKDGKAAPAKKPKSSLDINAKLNRFLGKKK